MKFKLFAVVLALSLMAWAQENPATSNPNSTPKTEAKSCCHHGQGEKGAMTCGHHASAEGKDGMDCCGKGSGCCGKEGAKCEKDGKSCCGGKGKDMKACADECKKQGGCADGKCCGMKGEKSAMKCCDGCEKKAS
ncbi:MAG TPA: hypothetical protein VMI10_23930 [Terriglobales bacterium]|nr:hypothetical protein [Terriglobales bacterium]